jgi:carboxypeptidase T
MQRQTPLSTHSQNRKFKIQNSKFKIMSAFLLLALMLGGLAGAGSGAYSANAAARVGAQTGKQPQTLVLRVYFRDNAERDRLAVEYDVTEAPTTDGYLTLWASQQTYDEIRARYPTLRIEIDQEQTRDANTPIQWADYDPSDPDSFYGGYKTVEEMIAFMDAKVAANPTLAEKVDIGDTWCKTHPGACLVPTVHNGYDMWVLHITNRNIPGPKPAYWYDAGIHSREIATPEVAMRFINMLLDEYNTNADSRWLVDYHDIWVMPMLNMDGHHVVEQGGEAQPLTQRKNLNNTNCAVYPPTDQAQLGIDLNRNFTFKWGCCGGSSGSGCNLTYRGPSAASEDETQAVQAKLRLVFPDQRGTNDNDPAPITTTGVMQTMHSVANLNLHPWGHTTANAPNYADLHNIGAHMSAVNAMGNNANATGNGYQYGAPPVILYSVDGDEVSWGYGELGIASYTTEVSGNSFFPSYACIDSPGCGSARGIWPENRGMLTYLAKLARTPYLTNRGPDTNLPTTNPMTVTVGASSNLTATINHVWTGNAYNQNIAAAEYYIDTPPWAGGTGIPMTAQDGAFDEPTEPVQAAISTTGLTPGRHIVFVRGRGVNDYAGFQSWGVISAVFLNVTSPVGGTPSPSVVIPSGTVPVPSGTVVQATNTVVAATGTVIQATSTIVPPTGTIVQATNTVGVVPTATSCASTTLLSEGFESGTLGAFEAVTTLGTGPWRVVSDTAASGIHSAAVTDPNEQSDQQLTQTDPVDIPSDATSAYLYFKHRYTFEQPEFDGGVLEYSTNGLLWTDAGPLITQGGYTGVITAASGNPLSARDAWVNESALFPQHEMVTVDLISLKGSSVQFRFREGSDLNTGAQGWNVDDISIVVGGQACPTGTAVSTTATATMATATTTACAVSFTDVPQGSTFYAFVQCLACRGIMGGYSDGTFRPNNDITRGQLSKIVSNSAGFNEPVSGQTFEDVPSTNTFYPYIERMANRGIIGGYPCGTVPTEPCGTFNMPYFRPNASATRGQISKIVSEAADYSDPQTGQTFEDVPSTNTFHVWIERLASRGIMGGYACGSPGEPCGTGNRPYFRPNNNATRGQTSKIVANTYFPECQPSGGR